MTVLEWLKEDEEWMEKGRLVRATVLERLAELIYCNGMTLQVTGWGRVEIGKGVYGRMGLTMNEAIQLLHLGGVLEGLCLAGGEVQKAAAQTLLGKEMERVGRERTEIVMGTEQDVKRVVGIITE